MGEFNPAILLFIRQLLNPLMVQVLIQMSKEPIVLRAGDIHVLMNRTNHALGY